MLDVYNLAVYAELYRNPIAGTPRIINYYEETGQLTVIEEYISGTSLQDKIRHADISPNEMLQYMLDLCTILEQLHLHNPAILRADRYLFYRDSSEGNGGSIALPESIY